MTTHYHYPPSVLKLLSLVMMDHFVVMKAVLLPELSVGSVWDMVANYVTDDIPEIQQFFDLKTARNSKQDSLCHNTGCFTADARCLTADISAAEKARLMKFYTLVVDRQT